VTTWLNLLAIAMGGAIGALSRYGITVAASQVPGGSSLWGTTIANLLGCVLLGVVSALNPGETAAAERLMLAIRVGFLGSLTTFSTFTAESVGLANEGRWGGNAIYLLANLVIGWIVLFVAAETVKGWTQ
jgi:CrcB protein